MKDDFYWTCFIHTGFLKCSVFLLRYSLQFRCINPVHHVSSRPSAIPCHSQTKIYRMMRMYILVLYIDKSRLNMHCHGCVILLKNHHSLIASKKETRLQSREFFHHFISIGRTKSRIYVVHYQTNLFMQCCLFFGNKLYISSFQKPNTSSNMYTTEGSTACTRPWKTVSDQYIGRIIIVKNIQYS